MSRALYTAATGMIAQQMKNPTEKKEWLATAQKREALAASYERRAANVEWMGERQGDIRAWIQDLDARHSTIPHPVDP